MPSSGVNCDVESFISEHIYSVEQLEVLLLLHQTCPREWSARQVAAELRTNASSAHLRLNDLTARGLLVRRDSAEPAYAYGPTAEDMNLTLIALRKLYAERHITVIHMIFSKPIEKFEAMRAFADAFQFMKKDT